MACSIGERLGDSGKKNSDAVFIATRSARRALGRCASDEGRAEDAATERGTCYSSSVRYDRSRSWPKPVSNSSIPIILATAVACGCSEGAVAPTAQSDGPKLQASVGSQVVHRASVGSPDACAAFGAKPGCDANFSLDALQSANGSVTGQWEDQFAQFPGSGGGLGIHVAVNCLVVSGNQAWVSGVITESRSPGLVGLDALTKVVDNGRNANDPADQISFSFTGTGIPCSAATGLGFPLLSVPQGQVVVQ